MKFIIFLFSIVYSNHILAQTETVSLSNTVGEVAYESKDHRSNVYEVVSDRKTINNNQFQGIIIAATDYYPYGSEIGARSFSGDYKYGFQGQEKDEEAKGKGNSINYKYRMHDTRIGRFFAVDPLSYIYPYNSQYAFSENRVADGVELEGLEYSKMTIYQQIIYNHLMQIDPNLAEKYDLKVLEDNTKQLNNKLRELSDEAKRQVKNVESVKWLQDLPIGLSKGKKNSKAKKETNKIVKNENNKPKQKKTTNKKIIESTKQNPNNTNTTAKLAKNGVVLYNPIIIKNGRKVIAKRGKSKGYFQDVETGKMSGSWDLSKNPKSYNDPGVVYMPSNPLMPVKTNTTAVEPDLSGVNDKNRFNSENNAATGDVYPDNDFLLIDKLKPKKK